MRLPIDAEILPQPTTDDGEDNSLAGVWQSEHSSTAWYKEADCSYCPFTRRGNQARVCQCTGKQHLCQLTCKLLGYRFIMCFSLTYRSSLISMIVVFLPLLMQWQYATVNLQRVWATTQRWWENTLLDVWKIKSSVIFQLAKEVLNRKQKDQKYSRFTVPAVCLKVEREWLPVTTVVNGTMRAASIVWYHLRHGLTVITSGHVNFASYTLCFCT